MESLGIVRKIDETGRIVLPKDFRRRLALEPNADAVELFADGDQIIQLGLQLFHTFLGQHGLLIFSHGSPLINLGYAHILRYLQ